MRKTVIILSVIALILNACGQTKSKTPEQTLKEFYTQHITVCDEMSMSDKSKKEEFLTKKSKIEEEFLTKEFRRKLDIAELDYDPFLDAQDCDKEWIKTLEITQITEQENMYKVCYYYTDWRGEQTVCIKLLLVKVNEKYLINGIENLN